MKYDIKLKDKSDGVYKVAEFEAEPEHASEWLAKYIFHHYPASFHDLVIDAEAGEKEKCLLDSRTNKVIWRPGEASITIPEGRFHYIENATVGETPYERWHRELPGSKKRLVTTEMDKAYDKGRKEGFEEGYAHATQVGKTQGAMDAGTHEIHHG
jgi:hypothetical protein